MAILQSNLSVEQAIAQLKAENEALKAKLNAQRERKTTLKVSEKGAVSVYGLGRFPVTLYARQWQRLADMGADILAFIEDNREHLSFKD